MEITAQSLSEQLGAEYRGPERDLLLVDIAPIHSAQSDSLTFIDSPKQFAALESTQAGAVLLTRELAERAIPKADRALLIVKDPFQAFLRAGEWFRPCRPRPAATISSAAHIHPEAAIGADVHIAPGVCIGAGAKIGARCILLAGVVVGEGTTIGEDCVLHPHVVLYPDVHIGNRVILNAHATVGADGFGYRLVNGQLAKIPHRGTVIIEDDVELGVGTAVDRGMIGPTVVGQGTKLDNLVQIAHNCRIGRHNAYAAQVGLAGSVTTGDYVRMGGHVGVADHLKIGHRTSFGGKAGVITDVPDGMTYHGIPAGPEKDQIRRELTLRRAPEVFDLVKTLRREVTQLQAELQQLRERNSPASEARAA